LLNALNCSIIIWNAVTRKRPSWKAEIDAGYINPSFNLNAKPTRNSNNTKQLYVIFRVLTPCSQEGEYQYLG
jgi:hypothetical protein